MPQDTGDGSADMATDPSRDGTPPSCDLGSDATCGSADIASGRTAWVLERVADAHITLNHECRSRYVNAGAERATGKARDEMLGRTHWEAFPASVDR